MEMRRRNIHEEMIFAEEAVIVEAQTAIHTLMEDLGVNRAELARRLDVSDARVSQMFSDMAKNLTLRTLGRVFRALGQECRITCDRLDARMREQECRHGATASGSQPPLRKRSGVPDFAKLMEVGDRLETLSTHAYAPVSNDNLQMIALADAA
jgi:hypothetical protein